MADYLHWDTQGPCPDGYHIPTYDDWRNIISTGTNIGARPNTQEAGNNVRIKLHLPLAGLRKSTSSNVVDQEVWGNYWSSSPYSTYQAYYLQFASSSISTGAKFARSYGVSVRPFKNAPVVPDNTWTVIHQGTGNAGIFHSTSLGLISLSSDGQTWITIADKNLGATTVYNDGNSLSEANCGKYYQWGNNYGFSYSGSVVKSNSKVDASGYGPGNYYREENFRYFSSDVDWSSVQNDNLWGGVTDERPEEPTPPTPTTLNKYITKLYHLGKEYIFDERISPTGINVSPTSINLTKLNQTAQITASVIPSNADDKRIKYVSSAPSIVSVSSTGLVKALGEGNATITVSSVEGGFSKSVGVVSAFNSISGYVLHGSRANPQSNAISSVYYNTNGTRISVHSYVNSNPNTYYLNFSTGYDFNTYTGGNNANPTYGLEDTYVKVRGSGTLIMTAYYSNNTNILSGSLSSTTKIGSTSGSALGLFGQNSDKTKLYGIQGDNLVTLTFTTAGFSGTMSKTSKAYTKRYGTGFMGPILSLDGKYMYVLENKGVTDGKIIQYELSTPRDISSYTYKSELSVQGAATFSMSDDQKHILASNNDRIYCYGPSGA